MDDIDKDGTTHSYEWRMHTAATNTVSLSSNPISIAGASASMDMHLLSPNFSSVTGASSLYNAGNQDPASTLIRITASAINPKFTFLMVPRTSGVQAPIVTRQATAWGCAATLDWGGGRNDVVLRNDSGASVSYAGVTTDGAVAVVRRTSTGVESYMMTKGLTLAVNGTNYVTFNNGTGSCEFASAVVQLNRYDADFKILNTGVSRVLYHDQDVGFSVHNGYVVPNGVTAVPAPAPPGTLFVHAWPNPFNPSTTVSVEGTGRERVSVVIYDVAGRRVRELWDGRLDASRSLAWDGRSDAATLVSSGTYFVRVTTPSQTRTLKLTLVK
jgi:hypothetical protein